MMAAVILNLEKTAMVIFHCPIFPPGFAFINAMTFSEYIENNILII